MDQTAAPPLAPDFVDRPLGALPEVVSTGPEALTLRWPDHLTGQFNRFWLRENAVGPGAINPVTRESDGNIDDLPEDLTISAARIDASGALCLTWAPDGAETRHHPGWLRDVAAGAWHPAHVLPDQIPWEAAQMPAPKTHSGPKVLTNDNALANWLRDTWAYGFARLEGLAPVTGTLEAVANRIGVIRASNFGFLFHVETKPNPDSTAYTSAALTGHTDLASRELQPGLQFLMCLENTCPDGASTMVDGFAVAEAMRAEDPASFDAMTTLPWVFSNRHRDSDYRFSGPIIELNRQGQVVETRCTSFLRAFPDMDQRDQPRAYAALRRYMAMVRSERFLCRTLFRPGDLVLFDNRRILHGRDSFDPQGGVRRLEGCYMERDELFSRLRVLARPGTLG